MLLHFWIKNYGSFADEGMLDLTATNLEEHSYCLIEKNSLKALPVITIYGPNAAGKTTFLTAIEEFTNFVINCIPSSGDSSRLSISFPYFLRTNPDEFPTEYEIGFVVNDLEYRYYVSVLKDIIQEENLEFRKTGKSAYYNIFRRTKGEKPVIGSSVEIKALEKTLIRYYSSVINPNRELLLTALGKRQTGSPNENPNSTPRFGEIFKWFQSINNCIILPDMKYAPLHFKEGSFLTRFYTDAELKQRQLDFVKKADHCIQNIDVRLKTPSSEKIYEVYTEHRVKNTAGNLRFPAELESMGTKGAIRIFPYLTEALDNGGILVIDELDTSLHPLLLLHIINTFMDPETNPKGAQLICTLHNALVMDKKYLRRDEIWFIDKNDDGESEIYALSDMNINDKKIRSDKDYCKQYILGTFDAIPKFMKKHESE